MRKVGTSMRTAVTAGDLVEATPRRKPMKAVLYERYGSPDVLRLTSIDQPVPKDNEILVKVHAASVNALDRHFLRSRPLFIRLVSGNGLLKPKDQRLGVDLAGRVEAVGGGVTGFQ